MIKIFTYNKSMQEDIQQFITSIMLKELEVKDKKVLNRITEDLQDIEHNYIENGGELLFAYDIDIKKIVGTIGVKFENDIAVLKRFYVDPEYRSQKVGFRLYSELENIISQKNISKVYLTTGKELEDAHRFYERNGWTKEKENPGIYCRKGADLYQKEITYRENSEIKILEQTDILVEAIPYISEFRDKLIIVKCGKKVLDSAQKDNLLKQIALLKILGIKVILVHGKDIETNSSIVNILNMYDTNSVSFKTVEIEEIKEVLNNNIIPVIFDENAGDYAADLAIALKAKKIIFVTDKNGVLDNNFKLISVISKEKCTEFIEKGIISGGMEKTIRACLKCLENSVERTHVLNGLERNTLLIELLSKNGIGTMIV